ncbi:acyl-CoA synthetase [Caulobacter sp. SSI4214]|uniref:acyl-CoA synthetase n=1 Tax=Caulobacter sp. SSI4214 TaxID=2575739 RepID=UPI001438E0DB|nr:acyl-CoA synthetase [Caulobacter sp. SSI4214]
MTLEGPLAHPSHIARLHPNRPAVIMAETGQTLSYGQMEARANQGAHLFRSWGLSRGDVVALCLENGAEYFEITWAAQRAGLYWTCISTRLTAPEAAYIARDCGARHLVVSASLADLAADLGRELAGEIKVLVSSGDKTADSFEAARDRLPTTLIDDPSAGGDMLYSSGTTGRPKGVRSPLPQGAFDAPSPMASRVETLFGFGRNGVYLSPAPLYHAAPLRWAMCVHRLGGTVVVMARFDAEAALRFIESHQVTCAQFVPTHFIRMLKLPEATRQYDVSSLRAVVHAAAPCPVPVKRQMIGWWGPIIHEYYGGTEGNGLTYISSDEWLAHPGSVGRAIVGDLKICDEAGDPLPPRVEGLVSFADGPSFTYHNDPAKTAETRNKHGWTSLGDIGWVDEEGYLYLTDRKSFMIISGGVNIYPQEIENALIGHDKIADIAVVGAPDPDLGEAVVAVVQPACWTDAGPELAAEILAYARDHLARYKTPRRVEFMEELPRHPTGKLLKRLIRDRMWNAQDTPPS